MAASAQVLPKGAVAKLKRIVVADRASGGTADIEAQCAEDAIEERLVWRAVGRKRPVRLLTASEVLGAYWELVKDFAERGDPIVPSGMRNDDLLESAVSRQHTGLGEDRKYPTLEMAAAALLHSIVHDHPFFNGNKRTALVAMLMLLDENGVTANCDEDELFQFVVRLGQHKLVSFRTDLADREVLAIAEWICANSRPVECGDRAIQWRQLRQILTGYECELAHAAGVGNRMNISRTTQTRGFFGRGRRRPLRAQVRYADDGRDAQVETVKLIRHAMQLDEEHGIDSHDFYRQGGSAPCSFIVKYRKTLERLSHL
jgi:death-on-curing family protein